MPIDLKSLQRRGAEVEIEFYDMTSIVEYDPTKFTPGFRADYQRKSRELRAELEAIEAKAKDEGGVGLTPTDIFRPNSSLLTLLVKSWDIIGVDGKALPIEADAILENLPDTLVLHIMTEIWSDVNQRGNRTGSTPTSKATAD